MSTRSSRGNEGFTLMEILVSTAILAMLLVILLSITSQASTMWRYTSGRIEQFRQAREAFDLMSRRLSQATLNTYWDYDSPTAPTRYIRQSELRFINGPTETIAGTPSANKHWPTHGVFFQAALGATQPGQTNLTGLNSLLNTWGYFVEFGDDSDFRPTVLNSSTIPPRYRFRLCEMIQPANELNIYQYTGTNSSGLPPNGWFADPLKVSGTRPVHELAENIIALVLLPKLPTEQDATGAQLAPGYLYDSTSSNAVGNLNPKNQLPPLIQMTMVSLDENSARRLENGSSMPDFGAGSLFTDPTQYDSDLQKLETALTQKHLSYRVFTTTVRLREAKWSSEQQN